jgi:dihydrofolate reductase
MNVTLIAVQSIDGKTTKWGEPNIYTWTSKEDHDNFFSHIDSNNFIVMGSKTYDAAKSVIRLAPNKITLVMTKNPSRYSDDAIPGQLEFTSQTPEQIIQAFKKSYSDLLLTGGAEINKLFFDAKLVNKIILTIEPVLFGDGTNLVESFPFDISLELNSFKQLNKKGTLLLEYSVLD